MTRDVVYETLKKSNVVIVAHEVLEAGGPGQDAKKYFIKHRAKSVLFIAHPLLSAEEARKKSSRYEQFTNGVLSRKQVLFYLRLPEAILYIKDFIYTIIWCIKIHGRSDIFVGLGPLNALSGIILRSIGLCNKVVYYSIDYFPVRFENSMLNKIYHRADKISVRFANETWNLGKNMASARAKNNNMRGDAYRRQFIVPIGVWLSDYKRNSFVRNNKKLIYAGRLFSYMGVDLIIRAMPDVLRVVEDVSLDIIGMGNEKQRLEHLVKKLGLENHVTFYNWIAEREAFEARLSKGVIGIAPFNTNILDDKVKNADPGKIKDYMLCGLTVIVTKALANYQQIEKAEAGIVIDYNDSQLSSAIIKLLENKSRLRSYRENAMQYVRKFDWNDIFGKNLQRLLGERG